MIVHIRHSVTGCKDGLSQCLEFLFVRHLRHISYLMAILGIAIVALTLAIDLPSMWTVAGMLLFVAGVVKIVMIVLWNGVAAVDTPPISREDA